MKKHYAYVLIALSLLVASFAPASLVRHSGIELHYANAQNESEKTESEKTENKSDEAGKKLACESSGGTWTIQQDGTGKCNTSSTGASSTGSGNIDNNNEPSKPKNTVPKQKAPVDSKEDAPEGYLSCEGLDVACYGINFLQILFVEVGNTLVGISAYVMDYFLEHTLKSSSYKDAGFILEGWEILRDFTNIAFIANLLLRRFR